MACHQMVVPPESDRMRVDVLIRKYLPHLSGGEVMAAFRRRDVKVDSVRVRQDARVRAGQVVRVYTMSQAGEALDIVYEDADVLLINKRAGMCVEADGQGGLSVCDLAKAHVHAAQPDAPAPMPAHRLDNQTCGLLLLSKNEAARAALDEVFRQRTMEKYYTCLVRGMPKPPEAVCRAWLTKDAVAARVTIHDRPVPGAAPIETGYETLSAGEISRLRVHLVTGRTHQIRAHLAALGHPLLGDDLYGDRAFNRVNHAQGRLMLCATSLTLHSDALPRLDGRTFAIEAPF